MKLKILPIIAIFLFLIGMVSAFDMPWVLRGKVSVGGNTLEGMQIQIVHMRNGQALDTVNVDTLPDGRFQYDITQFNNRVYDTEEICVIGCTNSPQCKKCIYKDNSGGKWVEINITDPNAKIVWIGGSIIAVGALLILLKKYWFKGFAKIIQFWHKKDPARAKKMTDSMVKKIK